MANDVKAVYTINNATIFPVVADAAVGTVRPSCLSDVCFFKQRQQEF